MDGLTNPQETNDVLDELMLDQVDGGVADLDDDLNQSQEGAQEQKPSFDPYKIKHLDDELEIDSVEKQMELVQKGADYDRIKAELEKQREEIKNNKALNTLSSIAKSKNLSVDDIVANIENEYTQENLKAFMGEHGITDLEAGKKLFDKLMGTQKENDSLSEIKRQRDSEAEARLKEEKELTGLMKFVKNTTGKDLDPATITADMYELAEKEEITLTEAYAQITLSKATENDKVNETNDQNKNSSVQDVTNSTGKNNVGKYSKSELEKMTDVQLAKTGLSMEEMMKILDSE